VDGQRGDILRSDDAPDRERRSQLVAALANDGTGVTTDAGRDPNATPRGRRSAQPSGPVMQQRQARRRRS